MVKIFVVNLAAPLNALLRGLAYETSHHKLDKSHHESLEATPCPSAGSFENHSTDKNGRKQTHLQKPERALTAPGILI